MEEGDEVIVTDTWTQGNNIWAKLKPTPRLPKNENLWSAMVIEDSKVPGKKNIYLIFLDEIMG